jgi:hypothetical protein
VTNNGFIRISGVTIINKTKYLENIKSGVLADYQEK